MRVTQTVEVEAHGSRYMLCERAQPSYNRNREEFWQTQRHFVQNNEMKICALVQDSASTIS